MLSYAECGTAQSSNSTGIAINYEAVDDDSR